MTDRAPQLDPKVVQLPDGRQLIYYPFPGEAPPADAPAPEPGAGTPPPPRREER